MNLLRNLDAKAFQESSSSEEGAMKVESRGLAFLAGKAVNMVLELGASPNIDAVAYKLAPFIL